MIASLDFDKNEYSVNSENSYVSLRMFHCLVCHGYFLVPGSDPRDETKDNGVSTENGEPAEVTIDVESETNLEDEKMPVPYGNAKYCFLIVALTIAVAGFALVVYSLGMFLNPWII